MRKIKNFKRDSQKTLKRNIRAVLIIYILSDGKKHMQKDIKIDFNFIYDELAIEEHVMDEQRIVRLYELFGDDKNIVGVKEALKISGKIDDSGISRVVKSLEKVSIVNRKSIKGSRGASPICNWLKSDPIAFLNILKIIKSLPMIWETRMFVSFIKFLIKSPYGKKTINRESIKNIVHSLKGDFNEEEELMILRIVKFSTSALFSLLDFYNDYGNRQELIVYDKEKIRKLLFGKLMFSVGEDLKRRWMSNIYSSISPPPLNYKIILDLNKEKLEEGEIIKTKYKVENNKLELDLKF